MANGVTYPPPPLEATATKTDMRTLGMDPGEGLLPYVGNIGMCHVALKGMVFKQFTVG